MEQSWHSFSKTSFLGEGRFCPKFESRKAHCTLRRLTFRNQGFNNCDQVLRGFAGAYMSIRDG